jgi:DNA-binding beta-propeller fold protein YncE
MWVTNQGDGTVSRFNPTTYVVDSPAVKVGNVLVHPITGPLLALMWVQ